VALIVVGIQKARAAAAKTQCQNNLRQIGLGLTGFHDIAKKYPPGTGSEKSALPFLNWQARILPYLDQGAMWTRIERAYQQQPNFLAQDDAVGATPVAVYICPAGFRTNAGGSPRDPAVTYYLGVLGVDSTVCDGMLYLDSAIKLSDVRDGSANTLFVGERPPSPNGHYGWWYAGWGQNKDGAMESVLGVRELNRPRTGNGEPLDFTCAAGPYHFLAGGASNHCDIFHFWSLHSGGSHFLFVDGSVRFLSYDADAILPGLATRAGGEPNPPLP
jgi:prepilin-type processing-associated H-X9-DG protein